MPWWLVLINIISINNGRRRKKRRTHRGCEGIHWMRWKSTAYAHVRTYSVKRNYDSIFIHKLTFKGSFLFLPSHLYFLVALNVSAVLQH